MTITITKQIAEVERELEQRRRVYPRLIAEGRLEHRTAQGRMAIMEAVLDTLKTVERSERLI